MNIFVIAHSEIVLNRVTSRSILLEFRLPLQHMPIFALLFHSMLSEYENSKNKFL